MSILQRATTLLRPFMGEDRRGTLLTLAFHQQHRDLYDAIPQDGAPTDFTVRCVSGLLDHGCVGSRHALSVLLDEVLRETGENHQKAIRSLIDELDGECALMQGGGSERYSVDPDGLQECKWCWWRYGTINDIAVMVEGLQRNKGNIVTRKRFECLTNGLSHEFANYLDADRSREIIKTANEIIEAVFQNRSATKLIVANFDGANLFNDWAGALIDADERGSQSLIALLLSMYLRERRLRSLADANLQRLHRMRR